MPLPEDAFIFDCLESKTASTARKTHIRRMYDILQLCIHRNDLPRARRAWAVLARCREIPWMSMWPTAIHIVGDSHSEEENIERRITLLREMMHQFPDQRETLLKELIFRLILSGHHREALDELELYLPSFPYQDDPVLHTYAGMLQLYRSQPNDDTNLNQSTASFDFTLLRDAKAHFERAYVLDPDSPLVSAFLNKVSSLLLEGATKPSHQNRDSDEDEGDGMNTSS